MTLASNSAVKSLTAFRDAEQGSILPIFGVMFLGITLCAGVALDFGRMLHAQTKMAGAADAAAIAAGKALLDGRNSEADVERIAKSYFEANLSGGFAEVSAFSAKVDRATNSVSVHLESTVPTTIMKIAKVDEVSIPVTSVATFDQKDIELAVALDVTGSMCMPCTKLQDMKSATEDLINIMLPDEGTPNKVRVGLVPYSSSVNAGVFAAAATDGRSTGCTLERQGAYPEEDDAPGPGHFVRPGGACPPSSKVIPLMSDKRLLKETVRGYTTSGSTAGHLGAQWASYMVSPKWGSIFGSESAAAPYDSKETVKAVILMTDGENNTFGGSNGNTSRSNEREREICAAMRDKGVLVFSIGFQLDNATAEAMLLDCAGTPSRLFRAENGNELRQAFAAIGAQLNKLRISK